MANKGKDRFKSSVGFTDMLFNLLVGFVFLFVIAFILINPPVKKSDAPKKAEYLIIIEWDHHLRDDVDLWVRDPLNSTVSYTNREGGLLNLEKDDLGSANDKWRQADGTIVDIPLNREVITMRGIIPGRYQVAAHIYNRGVLRSEMQPDGRLKVINETDTGTITATLVRINPYGEAYKVQRTYVNKGQVFTLFNFTLDDEGNITEIDETKNSIVYRMGRNLEGSL